MEPDKAAVVLDAPRIVSGKAMLLAGLRQRYSFATINEIPMLWRRFAPHIGNLAGQVGWVAYGAVIPIENAAQGFDYLCAVEVSQRSGLPPGFSTLDVPALRYLVFTHPGHVSRLHETIGAIWRKGLPESGREPAERSGDTPGMIERYGEGFDPETGLGDIELWVPIKS
jgi:AraC family transcriptional regulator